MVPVKGSVESSFIPIEGLLILLKVQYILKVVNVYCKKGNF